jgi:4-amino-4-deoxy-L-arabinose transferase-like glycosyltransferase
VMGLITGHNGTSRIFGGGGPNQQTPPVTNGPDGFNPNASPDNPTGQVSVNDGPRAQGGPMFSWETGSPGFLRFFQPPLAAEMSWLLPFALFSLAVIAFQSRIKLPVESGAHLGLLLWGGWLMTCVVFFSMVSGIFHSYYVVMLAPALGGVVGGGFGYLWQRQVDGRAGSGWWLTLGVAGTVAFQIFLAWQYGVNAVWMPLAFALVALATTLLFVSLFRASKILPRTAFSLLLIALMSVPLAWSALTVKNGAGANLPAAYGVSGPGGRAPDGVKNAAPAQAPVEGNGSDAMLEFLQANTQGMKYLLAVPSSGIGARYVLATGRPVLYMGGFGGNDNVVSANDLAQMVTEGELRYVLFGGGQGNKQEILNWLNSSCTVVEQFSQRASVNNPVAPQGPNQGRQVLYDCR